MKSRKVAILATLLDPGRNGSEGRLGPPESVGKAGNAEKPGSRFWPFLRGTRAMGQAWPMAARSEPGHIACPGPLFQHAGFRGLLEPSERTRPPAGGLRVQGLPRPFTDAGLAGLLEPSQRNRTLYGPSVSLAFPGQGPGPVQAPSQHVCMESSSKLEDALDSSALAWRPGPLCAHLERHGTAPGP